jgi:hypothetical protein
VYIYSEGQETGAIAPVPENACRKIWGVWSIANLGKIIPVPLKYLIFAMQNSSCGTPHGSDFL